ncbi:MAG: hypothetical protein Q8M34_04410 [Thermodesulfovibrionales bacterium]|nr:hypothetical protein [Thermodesulfovibrionales bacterium]
MSLQPTEEAWQSDLRGHCRGETRGNLKIPRGDCPERNDIIGHHVSHRDYKLNVISSHIYCPSRNHPALEG